jgi:hypothetical protein
MRETIQHAVLDPGARDTGSRSIDRVQAKIRNIVIDFCRLCLFDTFTMSQLNEYVTSRGETIAPDSAGRILRMLRKEKLVDYDVVNRAKSQYTITRVD